MFAVRPPVLPQFGRPSAGFGCRKTLGGYGQQVRESSGLGSLGQSRVSSTTRRSLRDEEIAGPMTARLHHESRAYGPTSMVASRPSAAAKVQPTAKARVSVGSATAVPVVQTKIIVPVVPVGDDKQTGDHLPDAATKPADKSVVEALEVVLTHIAAPESASGTQQSVFHATNVPKMPIGDYFARMRKYFDCSNECFVIALVYIDRLAKSQPHMVVDNKSCHRLFIVSTVVALKFQDDDYHDNAYYAKVGGLSLPELNKLEREFVGMLDWKLHVDVEQFAFYRDMMLKAVGDGKSCN